MEKNPQAFPRSGMEKVEVSDATLLDYFAGQVEASGQCPHGFSHDHEKRAKWNYDQGQAMLTERAKREEGVDG